MSAPESIPGRAIGGSPRNGMPASRDYAYNGDGRSLSPAEVTGRLRQRPAPQPATAPAVSADEPVPYWPAVYPGPGVPGRCPNCRQQVAGLAAHAAECGGGA